jgi:hypothetical protein
VSIRAEGLAYVYYMTIDGKALARHSETIRLISRTWTVTLGVSCLARCDPFKCLSRVRVRIL